MPFTKDKKKGQNIRLCKFKLLISRTEALSTENQQGSL